MTRRVLSPYSRFRRKQPLGMAVGPDGNVWVTDPGGNTITRMTPKGDLRHSRSPGSMLSGWNHSGKDGHLWFTEGGRSETSGSGCLRQSSAIER